MERTKKDLCSIFGEHGFQITIDANIKSTDYLDITLDLNTGGYCPYMKPGNVPLYVHSKSNHPQTILKNIPVAINKRLSEISSNEKAFNKAKPVYQQALHDAWYAHVLEYTIPQTNKSSNRQRSIIWYNPVDFITDGK